MTVTTEREILERMADSFRVAAECCDNLAKLPAQGPSYTRLREHLAIVENCCRQAGHWREDGRWFPVGLFCNKVKEGALRLILGHNPRREFTRLAEVLRAGQKQAEELRDKAPPKLGQILPEAREAPLRQGRPVQVVLPDVPEPANDAAPARKLIIPEGVSVH